jgi:hypothetical protein
MLRQNIEQPVRGVQALAVSLRETINNAIDARAENVRIMLGSFRGKEALITMDDGVGFDRKGLNSVMGYAASSRLRTDKKTIGANGTGIKFLLALGDLKNTKVTIITVSEEYPRGIEVSFDFDYLLEIFKKGADASVVEYAREMKKEEFEQIWKSGKRKTGSTIILTGFDKKKVKNTEQIFKTLSEDDEIAPRTSDRVTVFIEHQWKQLKLQQIAGTLFLFHDESVQLGKVELELYYGASNDGPHICGPINKIMSWNDLFKTLSKDQKLMVTKVLNSVGGHIYIENGNVFRTHDGSFTEDFYQGRGCIQLVAILTVVAGRLAELTDKVKVEKSITQQQLILSKIAEVSGRLFPEPLHVQRLSGNALAPAKSAQYPVSIDRPVYIVPRSVQIQIGESRTITLHNKGTEQFDFSQTLWESPKDGLVKVTGEGQRVEFKAGSKNGVCEVVAVGEFGEHTIQVTVTNESIKPFIKGPSYVNPEDIAQYEICRTTTNKVLWMFDGISKGFELEFDENQKIVRVLVPKDTNLTMVKLLCTDTKNSIIASKNIYVARDKKKPFVVKVGEEYYVMTFGMHYTDCIVQVEHDDEEELPTLVINPLMNPLYEALEHSNWPTAFQHVLNAIAMAGAADQIARNGLSVRKAMYVGSEFMTTFENELKEK